MTKRDRLTLSLVYAACVAISIAWWIYTALMGKDHLDPGDPIAPIKPFGEATLFDRTRTPNYPDDDEAW
jgi:hypothetical protein